MSLVNSARTVDSARVTDKSKYRVYKILVARNFYGANSTRQKCFWKYFYSLSDLAVYIAHSQGRRRGRQIFFMNLETALNKDEQRILWRKVYCDKCIDTMPDEKEREFFRGFMVK